MNETLAEEMISFISTVRSKGQNEEHLITELMKEYEGTKDDFIHFIEMTMIGIFPADMLKKENNSSVSRPPIFNRSKNYDLPGR